MAASGWRWAAFESAAVDLAAIGRQLLYRHDGGEVGILATVDAHGHPRVAPVCPIFAGEGVYLSVVAHTPKARDLARNPSYALHAQVGADDLEFQIRGEARTVDDPGERIGVIEAIPFPSFDRNDPILELLIERALVVTWAERSTRRQKRIWQAPATEK
ncbi:MAG: pyridoxamine 5'-phosphate oxidase family protein [Pseudomonadales bacterium]